MFHLALNFSDRLFEIGRSLPNDSPVINSLLESEVLNGVAENIGHDPTNMLSNNYRHTVANYIG